MAFSSINPTNTQIWDKLQEHFQDIKNKKILDWFATNSNRVKELTFQWDDFLVDFSKNHIQPKTLDLLYKLAEQCKLEDAIEAYFEGQKINKTEGRAVLHTALRDFDSQSLLVDGQNIIPEIRKVRAKIKQFTNDIISGKTKGYSQKRFTDVVNIGIGGSDLGPAMVTEALSFYENHLNIHFVSNVDGDHHTEILKKLNPETTLFIIVSKTFTTQETLTNAHSIKEWFLQQLPQEAIGSHFVAVSTNLNKIQEFGISKSYTFPMWNWVGGRFSLWSAVGLSIALSIGYEHFENFLKGASKMDKHFKSTPFKQNIPITAALISIWYNNFFETETEAILPYSQYLNQFATYLQQALMESNGKWVDRNKKPVTYQTGNIIWGEPGTNAQHAFFQLLHQGTKLIPAYFIGFTESLHGKKDHQDKLMANFIAQTEALLKGKDEISVLNESKNKDSSTKAYQVFKGNKPTTTLLIEKLTPESLGKLISFFEHYIFVQGVIWNIYSYDQFGVELGKQLAHTLLDEIESNNTTSSHDPSTQSLLAYYMASKKKPK